MSLVSTRDLKIQALTISNVRRILVALRKSEEFRARIAEIFSKKLIEALEAPRYGREILELADLVAFALSPLALESESVRGQLNQFLAQVAHDFMRFRHFNPKAEPGGEEKIAVLAACTRAWQLMSLAYGLNPLAFYMDMLLSKYQAKSREARELLKMLRRRAEEVVG